MEPITVTSKQGEVFTLSPGDYFKAIDRNMRAFDYQYIGIMPDGCGYDIYMRNETNGSFLNVELDMQALILIRRFRRKTSTTDADRTGTAAKKC